MGDAACWEAWILGAVQQQKNSTCSETAAQAEKLNDPTDAESGTRTRTTEVEGF